MLIWSKNWFVNALIIFSGTDYTIGHVWNIKVISSTDLSHTWFMLIKLIGFKLHCSHTEIVNVKRVPIKYDMWMYIYKWVLYV